MITWEEFKQGRLDNIKYIGHNQYQKTDIECPECGQPLYKNVTMILTSYPPQHQYHCMKCDWTGTSF